MLCESDLLKLQIMRLQVIKGAPQHLSAILLFLVGLRELLDLELEVGHLKLGLLQRLQASCRF